MVDFNTEWKRLDEQSSQTDAQLAAANSAYQSALKSGGERLRSADDAVRTAQAQPIPPQPQSTLPTPKDAPEIDPNKFQGLSMAMIATAMLGGSRGNWLGAVSALNGAMKGIIDGNQAEADRQAKDYERQYASAKAKDEDALRKYESILNNRKLTINEMLQQANLVAAENQHAEVQAATQIKSIESVQQAIEKRRMALLSLDQRNQQFQENLEARRQARSTSQLDDGGSELAARIYELTGQQPHTYGGMGSELNRLAADARTKGRSLDDVARDVASGRLTMAGQSSGARQATTRYQAVERLTGSVTELENAVVQLAREAGNSQVPSANATMNWIKRQMGDGKLQELHTLMGSVGRQYQEAVTMPGSNAQMHATAQAWADGNFNENMSLDQIQGSIRGMSQEIAANKRFLQAQVQESTRLPGGGANQSSPISLDDYLNKFGGR